jgi:hypothetical protein
VKLKITSVSVSKKGKVWIQAEMLNGLYRPSPDQIFDCKRDEESERRGTYLAPERKVKAQETNDHE